MATKTVSKQPVVEDQGTEERQGRDPDFTVLLRQQPERGVDGKLYRSKNMTPVGVAWRSEKIDDKTGEMVEYIGVKAHIKFEVGEEGLLLRTYRKRSDAA